MLAPSTTSPIPAVDVRRALLAWLAVTATVAVLDPSTRAIGWIHANIGAVAALLFLLVPGRIAPKDHPLWDPARFALLHARRAARPAILAILATALAFPLAYHLHATVVRGETPDFSVSGLARPAERFHGVPTVRERDVIHVYDTSGQITVSLASPNRHTLRVETDGHFISGDPESDVGNRTAVTRPPAQPATIRVQPRDASFVRVELADPDPSVSMRAGAAGRTVAPDTDGSWTIRLGWSWLVAFVLVHLLLVAFPEEFFYRGMLLPAFAATRWGSRGLGDGGLRLSMANVVTSALFAVAHFAVGLELSRLAVFFPSLVFGLLRERSDSIAGAIVYHAFCNVLLQVLSLQYLSA